MKAVYAVLVLGSIAFTAALYLGVAYVAVHFISKLW